MKNKKTDQKVFSFYSISSPCDFAARIKEEAVNSNLKIEQNDTDFHLQFDGNHGGSTVYKATVTADESGGSYISGKIITIPWSNKPNKKKSIIEKIFSIIGYIVVIPFLLVFLLCYGLCTLFVRLFRGTSIEPAKEDKLCDFMINKMCCKQKWDFQDEMKRGFEAYYSKAYAWIFAVLILLFLIGIAMFSIFGISELSLLFIITLSILSVIFVYVLVITIRKDGMAVQITDNKLILYKKALIEIPIEDISKISIHDGDGSFDIVIKTAIKKYSMHCFIKEQRKKKDEFIAILKNKGVQVVTFDFGGGN